MKPVLPAANSTLLRASPRGNAGTPPAANWGHSLPEGTRLGEFEITGVIGEGGFGIVYMAFDHSLQRRIALKEYMPSSLAVRTSGSSNVEVKSEHQVETFRVGLRSFVNEARLLAQFDHPALVKVHRFWEANGTAYMVMPFYEGPTLRAALTKLGRPPDEQWLRQLLDPLLDALSFLHAAQCFHRDVAPDNILLTSTGPLLLDFGAARRVIGATNQALTVILKPGYAPIEQYGQVTSLGQGPWTDIYALACVVYSAIVGKTPMASIERFILDRLEPVSKLAAGRYSENFLKAIDAGLAIKPEDRPQDIAQFRALLNKAESLPGKAGAIARTQPRAQPGLFARSIKSRARSMSRKEAGRSNPTSQADTPKRGRAIGLWVGLAAVVAVMTITGVRLLNTRQAAPQTSGSSQPPAAGQVVSAPIAQKAMTEESPTAIAPVNLPQPLNPALSSAPPEENIPPQAGNLSVEKNRAEASGDTANARESQRSAPAVSAGESTRVSGADNSADQAQRCDDLLQKASLESLSREETDFLRRDCK